MMYYQYRLNEMLTSWKDTVAGANAGSLERILQIKSSNKANKELALNYDHAYRADRSDSSPADTWGTSFILLVDLPYIEIVFF